MVPSFLRRRLSNSSSMCSAEGEECISIHHLVKNSNWSRLRVLLITSEGRAFVKKATALQDASDRSILHDLLSNDPPLDIVVHFLNILDDEHITNRDANNFGRTPFHEAVTHGADNAVLREILMLYPGVAAMTDDRGVTPLMTECSMGSKKCNYDTVKILVQSAPQQVMVEDVDGTTAIEYALMSGAIDIFHNLQHYQARELNRRRLEKAEERRKKAIEADKMSLVLTEEVKELQESFSKLDGHARAQIKVTPKRVSRSSPAA